MPRFGRRGAWVAIGLSLVLAAWMATLEPTPPPLTGHATVVDGDTIRLGGERIRLVGLDAPELAQTCRNGAGKDWPCGGAARDLMRALLARGEVTCISEGRDRYGRILARCGQGAADFGAAMVQAGLAVADGGYFGEAATARQSKAGIWQGSFVMPAEWRKQQAAGDIPSLLDTIAGWFR